MAQWSFHEAHLQVICLYNKAEIVVIYVWVGRKREGRRRRGREREGGRRWGGRGRESEWESESESEESSLPQPKTWLKVPGWGTHVTSLGWVYGWGGREREREKERQYLYHHFLNLGLTVVGVFPD